MTHQEINYAPLQNISKIFRLYVLLKRARMILFRVLILGFLVFCVVMILLHKDVTFSGGGTVNLSPGLIIFLWIGGTLSLIASMSGSWRRFAKTNQFGESKNINPKVRVPSFKGKRLALSLMPVVGRIDERSFGFFPRIYKEGGIVRWRERKMDTILWYDLPKSVPHVVVDSRFNEKARRSNLSKHYRAEDQIHFEGSTGDKYNVYTAKGNESAALQLFTPDVLNVFFDQLPQVDIEVKDRTIWFVWRYGVLDDQVAQALFNGTASFLDEFNRQLEVALFSDTQITAEI